MSHEARITEIQTYEESLPPYAYRVYCGCGWIGWQTFSREDARASHGAHLSAEQARAAPADQASGTEPR